MSDRVGFLVTACRRGARTIVWLALAGAANCNDAAHVETATADASRDTSPEGSVGAEAATIVWSVSPPPADGDGRLVDLGETNRGFGWDTCTGAIRVSSAAEAMSLPASRGTSYLLSTPSPGGQDASTSYVAQAYFWLETPGPAQGLWFDLALVSGLGADATISFYETDNLCVVKRSFGTFGAAAAFSAQGRWKSGCLDVSAKGVLQAIGVRIEAPSGTVAFDALRFDKPCK
jgi:hypothetical protein